MAKNQEKTISTQVHRLALGVSYTGTRYKGWQCQPNNVPTIQGDLEQALSQVAKKPIRVVCAGRTDTGVHALGQIVHFDVDVERPLVAWLRGTNTFLPEDIRVHWAKSVPFNFDARYSAVKRRYRYVILNASIAPAVIRNYVSWVYYKLDVDKMHEASQMLIGKHDFSAFRGSHCQAKSPIRTLTHLSVVKKNGHIILTVEANAFLHHMVRNIAGVLIAVGQEKKPVEWAKQVLESKQRREAGITAPPHGLYLEKVEYPEEFGLDNTPVPAWYLPNA